MLRDLSGDSSTFSFDDYFLMEKVLHTWESAGKEHALNSECQTLNLAKDEYIDLLQVFYDDVGVWSLGFLTSEGQIVYFGSE